MSLQGHARDYRAVCICIKGIVARLPYQHIVSKLEDFLAQAARVDLIKRRTFDLYTIDYTYSQISKFLIRNLKLKDF